MSIIFNIEGNCKCTEEIPLYDLIKKGKGFRVTLYTEQEAYKAVRYALSNCKGDLSSYYFSKREKEFTLNEIDTFSHISFHASTNFLCRIEIENLL